MLLLQLGDGDLLVGFSDGRIERPLPDDAGLVGEQTHSLCDPDAARSNRFRLQVLPLVDGEIHPEFLMISTDGLSKSFPDDQGFMKVAGEWYQVAKRNSIEEGTRGLETWLSNASQRGSGDDITLGLALRSAPATGMQQARLAPGITRAERRSHQARGARGLVDQACVAVCCDFAVGAAGRRRGLERALG